MAEGVEKTVREINESAKYMSLVFHVYDLVVWVPRQGRMWNVIGDATLPPLPRTEFLHIPATECSI